MSLIDMHCHILPNLDDGSGSLNESIAALREAKKQGVDEIILTPHHHPNTNLPVDLIYKTKELLEDAVRMNHIDIKFHMGQECFYHTDLPNLLDREEVLTLADSKYVLVEFQENASFRDILYGIRHLKESGYEPILAHYERYLCLMQKGKTSQLKNEGILLQMNFDTIQRQYGFLKKNLFQQDLKKGYIDFMASDCHGIKFRKYYIEPTITWMKNNIAKKDMDRILFENPKKIINHIY